MVSSVVRLRLPSDGVWGLPVAIHEYGHFVAANVADRAIVNMLPRTVLPVEDLLSRDTERPKLYWYGHELFADAFAAATVGPAYTWYCTRFRFSPAGVAPADSATHPPAALRVRTQLAVLDQLAADDPARYLPAEVIKLRTLWDSEVVNADPALEQLERDIVTFVLENERLKRVRYGDDAQARQLAAARLEPGSGRPEIVHILNAAWYLRSSEEDGIDDAGRREARSDSLGDLARALLERATADG
jgi:hypothetical protein